MIPKCKTTKSFWYDIKCNMYFTYWMSLKTTTNMTTMLCHLTLQNNVYLCYQRLCMPHERKKMSKINRNIWCWFDFFYNLFFLQRGRNVIGFWNTCSSNEVRIQYCFLQNEINRYAIFMGFRYSLFYLFYFISFSRKKLMWKSTSIWIKRKRNYL